jgi:hypothetical protein
MAEKMAKYGFLPMVMMKKGLYIRLCSQNKAGDIVVTL